MKSRIAMVASVLALALVGSACSEESLSIMATARSGLIMATAPARATSSAEKDIGVMYEVTGDANGVRITMVNETGGISQGNFKLPYKFKALFPHDIPILSISAQIIDPTWGSPKVACRIATGTAGWLLMGSEMEGKGWEVGGKGWEVEAEASGPGNIATCLWENADN